MKKVLRVITRLVFHIVKFFLRLLEATYVRAYMSLYTKFLAMYGVKFTGKPRYISTRVKIDNFNKVQIGERVVISDNVILLTHDYSLTTALIAVNKTPKTDIAFIKPIVIKNNVFIGMNSLILPGTVINENVIVGAGSVVRGTVPPNSLILGNPAAVVGTVSDLAEKWEKNLDKSELNID